MFWDENFVHIQRCHFDIMMIFFLHLAIFLSIYHLFELLILRKCQTYEAEKAYQNSMCNEHIIELSDIEILNSVHCDTALWLLRCFVCGSFTIRLCNCSIWVLFHVVCYYIMSVSSRKKIAIFGPMPKINESICSINSLDVLQLADCLNERTNWPSVSLHLKMFIASKRYLWGNVCKIHNISR